MGGSQWQPSDNCARLFGTRGCKHMNQLVFDSQDTHKVSAGINEDKWANLEGVVEERTENLQYLRDAYCVLL